MDKPAPEEITVAKAAGGSFFPGHPYAAGHGHGIWLATESEDAQVGWMGLRADAEDWRLEMILRNRYNLSLSVTRISAEDLRAHILGECQGMYVVMCTQPSLQFKTGDKIPN